MLLMNGSLAAPAIISNITVPLLGLSDTFITGHLGSARFIAAISVGTMMVNVIYWLCGFLRMGTTGLAAEAYGSGDKSAQHNVLTAAALLGFLLGTAMIILSPALRFVMLRIMVPPIETASLAGEYFIVTVLGSPAILATMALSGWMVGSQNTVYPMIVAITVNVINIALSLGLVYLFDAGFMGVAYGTLTANWAGVFLSLWLAKRLSGSERLFVSPKGLLRKIGLKRFFKVNGNLFIRSAFLMSVTFALTTFAGQLGDHALAVNAILTQFFMFFSYFMDGFAFSGEALCGRFAGASDKKNLICSIKALAVWSGLVTLFFTILYLLFTPDIAGLLTNVESVVNGVIDLQWIACVLPVVAVAAFMFDGVYIGLTDTGKMMIATMTGAVVFFLIHYLTPPVSQYLWNENILRGNAGLGALWIAFLCFLSMRGLILSLSLRSSISRRFEKI